MRAVFSKFILTAAMFASPLTAAAKDISISVNGMVCGFCAQGIEKKFKALPQVKSVEVSLEKKLVKVITKDNQDIDDAKINEILHEAGYNIDKIQR